MAITIINELELKLSKLYKSKNTVQKYLTKKNISRIKFVDKPEKGVLRDLYFTFKKTDYMLVIEKEKVSLLSIILDKKKDELIHNTLKIIRSKNNE